MTRFPILQILEGENLSVSLQGENDTAFLFGDDSGAYLFELSKKFDHLRSNYFSPLYKKQVPSNSGYFSPAQTLEGEDGNLYHFSEKGDLLGCSLCSFAGMLAGEEIEQYDHYNQDGTLAGVTVIDANGKQFLYEGGYELNGFSLGKIGGFKMPKIGGFKMPKIKMPKMKINIPKIKIPKINTKINIPKIKMPNFKVPNIGKQIGKATSQIGKGFSNIGNQIGKGVNKYISNIGEGFQAVGDLATGLLDTAGSLLSPGAEGMPQEEQTEEGAGELTPQDPGYTDENGYTASDGIYYSHDNQNYFDFQANQWIPLNANTEQNTGGFSEIGYTDENGYRADDGLFYSHDGQYVLNEQTNEWIQT